MSNDFTPVDLYNLPFPSTFNIDYVRCVVGRRENKIALQAPIIQ